jgi:hypothetical protein
MTTDPSPVKLHPAATGLTTPYVIHSKKMRALLHLKAMVVGIT